MTVAVRIDLLIIEIKISSFIHQSQFVQCTNMKKQWERQLEQWENLRDQADGVIKSTLKPNFPDPYGRSTSDISPKSNKIVEKKIGRALSVYARSDITIKTMQMNFEETKKKS